MPEDRIFFDGHGREIPDDGEWREVGAMSEEEILEAIRTDPDTRLLTPEEFRTMRRPA